MLGIPSPKAFLAALVIVSSASAAVTSEGCYTDDGSLTSFGTNIYQSEGTCQTQCANGGYAVFAMSDGNQCSCGNSLPPSSVASSFCSTPCVGYPDDICGGTGYYSVYLTGVGTLAGGTGTSSGTTAAAQVSSTGAAGTSTRATTAAAAAATTTTPTPTTAASPSVVYITTAVVQQGVSVTVVQTVSASTKAASATSASASGTSGSKTSSSSSNSASGGSKGGGGLSGGAIAGIVIGVLALAAIAALAALLLLRRRRRESEDFGGEYKKHIEPAGAGVTRNPSAVDNRLDTSLAVRRNSAESLADNQDYSRKILRVVN